MDITVKKMFDLFDPGSDACKREMLSWVRTKTELHAVYRKYKSNRYGNVSNEFLTSC